MISHTLLAAEPWSIALLQRLSLRRTDSDCNDNSIQISGHLHCELCCKALCKPNKLTDRKNERID